MTDTTEAIRILIERYVICTNVYAAEMLSRAVSRLQHSPGGRLSRTEPSSMADAHDAEAESRVDQQLEDGQGLVEYAILVGGLSIFAIYFAWSLLESLRRLVGS